MAELNRDGTAIHYEWYPSAAQDAPSILLSHGYSATASMWHGQIKALTTTHNLITWDMRGHGRSASPEDPNAYSEQLSVDDMAGILRECGVERAIIGGLSLGGYMTLAFHLAHPDMCDALMLFDTGPGYKSDKGRAAWNESANERGAALDAQGLAALGKGSEVRVAEHTSASGLAHAARGMLAQHDDRVIQSLPHIELPTLVLVGEDDAPFRIPTEYMANKIPNAKKVILEGAGHAANIDKPEGFNQAVRSFLESL
ncbi:MAG: alpha/beta hydrolase [Gammaproteobacteria bacterium]|nr:alpha/beta hydrolase [Gammaproteobacteria bacterium]|tara:strand:+ start:661 stop:1428 length:768 start_codon:yes stop_codon:yes gene_type:complete